MDGHAPVHGLAHVVNGEQGYLHGGEGFHLYAGGADGFHGCGTKYACSARLACAGSFKFNSNTGQRQRVAQRDGTKWGQTPISLSALHNQIGVTGPKFGKDGAFRSITADACNGPCMLQCYM